MAKTQQDDIGRTVTTTATVSSYKLFGPSPPAVLDRVRVFDVGQGDCLGIADPQGQVAVYVDYGGLFNHPNRTSSFGQMAPVSKHVTIVLTHWDKDHYHSATFVTAAQGCQWLVPRQRVGPQATRFAKRLQNAACWPASLGKAAHRFAAGGAEAVQIEKIDTPPKGQTWEDRNLTGLAVTLIGTASKRMIVLPGDAPYDRIPSFPLGGYHLRGLVAYHHGAKSHWTAATAAALPAHAAPGDMAYSYGQGNSYKHPVRASYQQPLNWDANSLDTPGARQKRLAYIDIAL